MTAIVPINDIVNEMSKFIALARKSPTDLQEGADRVKEVIRVIHDKRSAAVMSVDQFIEDNKGLKKSIISALRNDDLIKILKYCNAKERRVLRIVMKKINEFIEAMHTINQWAESSKQVKAGTKRKTRRVLIIAMAYHQLIVEKTEMLESEYRFITHPTIDSYNEYRREYGKSVKGTLRFLDGTHDLENYSNFHPIKKLLSMKLLKEKENLHAIFTTDEDKIRMGTFGSGLLAAIIPGIEVARNSGTINLEMIIAAIIGGIAGNLAAWKMVESAAVKNATERTRDKNRSAFKFLDSHSNHPELEYEQHLKLLMKGV